MKIKAMLLAAIVIGTLLSSASVAQALRCYCDTEDEECKDFDISHKRGIQGNWSRRQSMWTFEKVEGHPSPLELFDETYIQS